jgi:hypothetical protein
MIPFMKVIPKPLGIQLYAVAHNRLSEWRNFSITDYGDFDSFTPPKHREQSIQKLLESSGIRND